MELIDKVKYQQDAAHNPGFRYWQQRLESVDAVFRFSQKGYTTPGSTAAYHSHTSFAQVPGNTAAQLTCCLAALSIVLERYEQQGHVIIDTPPHRPKDQRQQSVPLVMPVHEALPAKAFIRQVNGMLKDTYRFQDFPLKAIHEHAYFKTNVFFSYDAFHGRQVMRSGYDLVMDLQQQGEQILVTASFNAGVFDSAFIQNFLGHYVRVLSVIANAAQPVCALSMLSPEESSMLAQFSLGDAVAYPEDALLHQLVSRRAKAAPGAPAIIFAGTIMSYGELDRWSGMLAQYLHRSRKGQQQRIGIFMERSEWLIVSILAVLKAGAAYVPINTALPAERIAFMLQDAGIDVLLTESRYLFGFDYFGGELFAADVQLGGLPEATPEHLPAVQPADVAYVMYTSGSTGVPKGVAVPHGAILNTIQWRNAYYEFSPADKFLQVPAFSFDSSVEDIFCALTSGASLVMMEEDKRKDVYYLRGLIHEQGITHFLITPSLYAVLLDIIDTKRQSLRAITVAGEAVTAALAARHFGLLPQVRLVNEYGPTENAVCATVKELRPGEAVTIGRPISNVSLYILDNYLHPVPVGVQGEIYLAGAGLCSGYLNNDELNDRSFVPNPFVPGARMYRTGDQAQFLPGGDIRFAGRKDHQVKLNGIRMELEEIETVVRGCRGVQDCRVLFSPGHGNALRCIVKADAQAEPVLSRLAARAASEPGWLQQCKLLPNGMLVQHKNNAETDLTYQEIFIDQLYHRHGITVQDGDTVFDAGANIGMFTAFMGVHFPGCRVYAFEPIAPIFEVLEQNAGLYNPQARVFNIGLSHAPGEAEMIYYYNNTASSGLFADADADKDTGRKVLRNSSKYATLSHRQIDELVEEGAKFSRQLCRLDTLANFMDTHGIARVDLLKLDVEKSELNVLRGLDAKSWGRIRQIVAEVHDMDDNMAQVEDLLRSNGFAWTREQPQFLAGTGIHYLYASRQPLQQHQEKIPVVQFNQGQRFADLQAYRDHILSECGKMLPQFMIPGSFTVLDKFPLTINGKLDTAAIAKMLDAGERAAAATPDLPRNELEQLLCAAWCKVTGRSRIGIHENFFQAGGDSIKAIQVAASLYAEGYKVEVKDIFELPTIAQLAAVAAPVKALTDQAMVTGDIPLTPIQLECFPPAKADAHHFNQALLLRPAHALDTGMLRTVFAKLHQHHDALRIVFQKDDSGWRQFNKGDDYKMSVEEHSVNTVQELEAIAAATQKSIDLANGPLMKVVLFHLQQPSPAQRLLLVMHHTITDGVSWRILLEDLATLLRQHRGGQPLQLPPKTASFRQWAEALRAYAAGHEALQQLPYWESVSAAVQAGIPFDPTGKPESDAYANYQACEWLLDTADTQLLTGPAHLPYNTQINDLLLAALSLAMQQTFGMSSVAVDLEGHGREQIAPGIDVGRTIGWFTSVYPIVLRASPKGLADHIIETKEMLRSVPAKGIGYGILKYLSGMSGRLTAAPQVSFNYLGQFGEDFGNNDLLPADESTGETFSMADTSKYELNVSGFISGGRLSVSIHYNASHFLPATVQRLADNYRQQLAAVARFCAGVQQRALTPSDVSGKNVSRESLDKLSSIFQ